MTGKSDRSDRVRRSYNLHLLDCRSAGYSLEAEMPALDPVDFLPYRLVDFTARGRGGDPQAGVHFFLDDYKFEGVWSDPLRYVPSLSRFGCALTPDFSVFLDMPEPMQLWNVYRGRAVGRMWQDAGLAVVPTLTWGEPNTYAFAFDGIPQGSTVALSTVGLMDCPEGKELFEAGASEACRRLAPKRVLAYGREHGFDANGAEVIWFASGQQERFAELRAKRRAEKESERKEGADHGTRG